MFSSATNSRSFNLFKAFSPSELLAKFSAKNFLSSKEDASLFPAKNFKILTSFSLSTIKNFKNKYMMEEKAKEIYLRMELIKQELEKLREHREAIFAKLSEISQTITNLKSLEGIKTPKEGFSYLGAGIYLKSSIVDVEKVLVHAGGKIFVEEDRESSIERLERKRAELEDTLKKIDEEIENLGKEFFELSKELDSLSAQK